VELNKGKNHVGGLGNFSGQGGGGGPFKAPGRVFWVGGRQTHILPKIGLYRRPGSKKLRPAAQQGQCREKFRTHSAWPGGPRDGDWFRIFLDFLWVVGCEFRAGRRKACWRKRSFPRQCVSARAPEGKNQAGTHGGEKRGEVEAKNTRYPGAATHGHFFAGAPRRGACQRVLLAICGRFQGEGYWRRFFSSAEPRGTSPRPRNFVIWAFFRNPSAGADHKQPVDLGGLWGHFCVPPCQIT